MKHFYIVVKAGDLPDLEEAVNQKLDEGFEMFGSPTWVGEQHGFIQGMLKMTELDASVAYNDYVEEMIASEPDLKGE